MQLAWKHSAATGSTRLVLLALADHANENFEAWPSQSTLARLARVTDRQVRNALRWLEGAGEIAVVRTGVRGVKVYRITCGPSEQEPPTPEILFRPEPQFQSPRKSSSGHPGNPVPTNHQRTTKEPLESAHGDRGRLPSITRSISGDNKHEACPASAARTKNTEIDLAFAKFWERYPSRTPHSNPRKPARERFAKAISRGVDPQTIIRGAENYAAVMAQRPTDPRYIAQAMTWLNQERWNDHQHRPVPARQDDGLC